MSHEKLLLVKIDHPEGAEAPLLDGRVLGGLVLDEFDGQAGYPPTANRLAWIATAAKGPGTHKNS